MILPRRPALVDVLFAGAPDVILRDDVDAACQGPIVVTNEQAYSNKPHTHRLHPASVAIAGTPTLHMDRFEWCHRTSNTAEWMETLCARGILPDAFHGDPARQFLHTRNNLRHPHPEGPAALVAWASLGAAAILRYEALAREIARRLAPWKLPQVPRALLWHCTRTTDAQEIYDLEPWADARNDARVNPLWQSVYQKHAAYGDRFASAVASVETWFVDRPPCPFEPFLTLLRAGLGLEIWPDALVLYVPPVEGHPQSRLVATYTPGDGTPYEVFTTVY